MKSIKGLVLLYLTYVSFIPYFRLLVFGILVTLVAWFSFCFFFCLAHLTLQNVNKHYIIFSYFHNFVAKSDQKVVAKSDQKLKTEKGMNKTLINQDGKYVCLEVLDTFLLPSTTKYKLRRTRRCEKFKKGPLKFFGSWLYLLLQNQHALVWVNYPMKRLYSIII